MNIICNISKPEIMELAKKEGKTRSQVSMREAKSDIDGGIVAIGNAPTALQEVIKMVKEGIVKPASNHRYSSRLHLCSRI